MDRHPKIPEIRREATKIAKTFREMTSDQGWTLSYDGPSTKVHFRREPDSQIFTFKIEGVVLAKAINIACIINEFDLYAENFWFIRDSKTLKKTGRLRRVLQCRAKIVWPIADREFLTYAAAVDGLDEDDCIAVMTIEDLSKEPVEALERFGILNEDLIQGLGNPVRASMEANFIFTPLEPTKTKVVILTHVDLSFPLVPAALLNWCGKAFGRFMVRAIESRANSLTVNHQKKLETDPVYSFIEERIGQHWEAKGRRDEFNAAEVDLSNRVSAEFDANETPAGPGKKVVMAMLSKRK